MNATSHLSVRVGYENCSLKSEKIPNNYILVLEASRDFLNADHVYSVLIWKIRRAALEP